jgi:hypothetical protein
MKTIKTMILSINELPKKSQKPVTLFLAEHGITSLLGGKNKIECPKNSKLSIAEQIKSLGDLDPLVQEAMLWVEKTYNLDGVDSVMIDRIKSKDFMRKESDDIEIDYEK